MQEWVQATPQTVKDRTLEKDKKILKMNWFLDLADKAVVNFFAASHTQLWLLLTNQKADYIWCPARAGYECKAKFVFLIIQSLIWRLTPHKRPTKYFVLIMYTVLGLIRGLVLGCEWLHRNTGLKCIVYSATAIVYSLWSLPTSVLYFLWLNNFTCFEASYTFASFVIIFMRAWQ